LATFQVAGTAMKPILETGIQSVRPSVDVKLSFNLINQEAVKYAALRSAELVQGVVSETRAIIRDAITRGVSEGITVQKTAQGLRTTLVEGGKIVSGLSDAKWNELAHDLQVGMGLNRQQWRWLQDRKAKMRDEGVDEADVQKYADAYADKLLRLRANTIARTEPMRAANEGNAALMNQAIDAGYLDAATDRKFWLVTPTDKPCEMCQAIAEANIAGVPLNQPFINPDGDPLDTPPAHPNCKCAFSIEAGEERLATQEAA
jgi:hypothetical protein